MANYWIKAYIEILDDPKMATLPDRLWRRVMELFLMAGKYNDGGNLPETSYMAWLLRTTTDELEFDLKQLETTGIIRRVPGGWFVVNYEKRQASAPTTERVRQYRERQHREQYYNPPVTEVERIVTQNQNQNQNQIQKEESTPPPATTTNYSPIPQTAPKPANLMQIINRASGLSAIPPKEYERLEQIQCMVDAHGAERVEYELKCAVNDWKATKGKNGSYYRIVNMAWVDRAQDALDNSTAPVAYTPGAVIPDAQWRRMTQDQNKRHLPQERC